MRTAIRIIITTLALFTGVVATQVAPVMAKTNQKITPKDMTSKALQTTIVVCKLSEKMLLKGLPVSSGFKCVNPRVWCRWHPPLAPDIGYCLASFEKRGLTAGVSFLHDEVCQARPFLFYRKYRSGTQQLAPGRTKWPCRKLRMEAVLRVPPGLAA